MKYIYHIIYIAALLLTGCSDHKQAEPSPTPAVDTIPMMVMQIQKCSRLYTSEYQLHKIVSYDDSLSFNGSFLRKKFKINLPIGKRKVAIPITAHVKAYIDLSKISEKNVRRHGDRIEIILPDPEVIMTSTRIDHEAIKKKVSVLRSNFTDEELTRIQQQGRKGMIQSLAQLNIIEHSRQSAARQLIPIVEQMGYNEQQVTITFRKKFSLDDLTTLIKHLD